MKGVGVVKSDCKIASSKLHFCFFSIETEVKMVEKSGVIAIVSFCLLNIKKTCLDIEIKSRFHILYLEVSHGKRNFFFEESISHLIVGSDRYDIQLHMERPPVSERSNGRS